MLSSSRVQDVRLLHTMGVLCIAQGCLANVIPRCRYHAVFGMLLAQKDSFFHFVLF